MLRRTLIFLPGFFACAMALLQLGCGDDGTPTRADAGDSPSLGDSGLLTPGADGAASDMSSASDLGGGNEAGDPGFPANAEAGFDNLSSSPRGAYACYGSGALDCDASDCSTIPVCCVGSAADGCCRSAALVPQVQFSAEACTTLDCAGARAQPFGAPGPNLEDGLVTGGGATSDGGLVFAEAVDLRNRSIRLTGTLRAPAECLDGCFETIGLALLQELPAPSGEVLARPLVALRYSGASRRVYIEVNGNALQFFDEEPNGTWSLMVTPTGGIRVEYGASGLFAVEGRVRPAVVYPAVVGRTRNPSASGGESAALTSLQITTAVCDVPSGWQTGGPIEFTEAPRGSLRVPSLALGTPTVLSVEVDGQPRFYQRSRSERYDPLTVASPDPRIVHDLRLSGAGEVVAIDDRGAVLSGHLEGLPDAPTLRWDDEPLVSPCDPCERTHPSITQSYDGTPLVLLLEDGAPALYASGTYQESYSSTLMGLLAPDSAAGEDRIQSLDLREDAGAWRLDVTYVRGTRASVRHFASDEMVLWREFDRVFEPSGTGFERLRVWDFAVARDVAGGAAHAVYVANDGVRDRLGSTSRPTP